MLGLSVGYQLALALQAAVWELPAPDAGANTSRARTA